MLCVNIYMCFEMPFTPAEQISPWGMITTLNLSIGTEQPSSRKWKLRKKKVLNGIKLNLTLCQDPLVLSPQLIFGFLFYFGSILVLSCVSCLCACPPRSCLPLVPCVYKLCPAPACTRWTCCLVTTVHQSPHVCSRPLVETYLWVWP